MECGRAIIFPIHNVFIHNVYIHNVFIHKAALHAITQPGAIF